MAIKEKIQKIVSHQGVKRYAANTSWMLAEQMLRILSGLFVGVWVARYLGPEQFGLFSYVLAFTSIFAGIAKLGMDGIIVRDLVQFPSKNNSYLGTAFWLKAIGGLISLLLILAILPFASNNKVTNLYILIVAAGTLFQSFEVVEFYFQSRVLAKVVSICKTIQLTLSTLLKVYLVLTGADLVWFVLVTALDTISLAICYFASYKMFSSSGFYRCFDIGVAKKILKDAWPLIFSTLFYMLYTRIDQIMIKEILGERDVGIYSVATKLSELAYVLPMLITASMFPAIISAKETSVALYRKRLQKLYTFLIWLSIGIALTSTLLSNWLIDVFFGEAYQEAAAILKVHAWSIVFISIGYVFGKFILAENLVLISLYRTLLGAMSNIILNYFFIPLYGAIGAAYATLISLFITHYASDVLNKKLYGQLVMKTMAIIHPFMLAWPQREKNETK